METAIAVSGNVPAAAVPRGDGVESRGWGRGAPQSSSSLSLGAPARNDKIYKSDEVFLIEKTNKNDLSNTQPSLEIPKSDVVSPIGEANTNATSQTPPTLVTPKQVWVWDSIPEDPDCRPGIGSGTSPAVQVAGLSSCRVSLAASVAADTRVT